MCGSFGAGERVLGSDLAVNAVSHGSFSSSPRTPVCHKLHVAELVGTCAGLEERKREGKRGGNGGERRERGEAHPALCMTLST
eukprot:3595137-Rhodomonas_salina.1